MAARLGWSGTGNARPKDILIGPENLARIGDRQNKNYDARSLESAHKSTIE